MAAPGEKSYGMLEYHTSKSVVTVKRAFRAKYAKDPPTDKTISAWYKHFTETGCLCKQKSCCRPLTAEDEVERVRASSMCAVSLAVHTSNISSCKKTLFQFPCGYEKFL